MTCLTETEPGKKWVKHETGGWNAEKIRWGESRQSLLSCEGFAATNLSHSNSETTGHICLHPSWSQQVQMWSRSQSFTVEKVSPARLPKPQLAERASQRTLPLLRRSAPIHVCQEIHLLLWKALFILGGFMRWIGKIKLGNSHIYPRSGKSVHRWVQTHVDTKTKHLVFSTRGGKLFPQRRHNA